MSALAFMLIFPLPSTNMFLPLTTIVPSFFIEMLALPVLMVTESPASMTRFLPTFRASSLPTSALRPPVTLRDSSAPTLVDSAAPTSTDRAAPTLRV